MSKLRIHSGDDILHNITDCIDGCPVCSRLNDGRDCLTWKQPVLTNRRGDIIKIRRTVRHKINSKPGLYEKLLLNGRIIIKEYKISAHDFLTKKWM